MYFMLIILKLFVIGASLVAFALPGVANAASTVGTNLSTTGTFTQTVGSATAAQFQNAAGTITVLLVDTTNNRVGVNPGAALNTTFEIGGTASAAFVLINGALQAAGTTGASTSYSRFGTTATGHANYVSAANDLLVSGDLEVRGSVSFAGPASISGAFTAAGPFKPTANSATAFRFQNAAGDTNVLIVDTTNLRVGIGATPGTTFEVQGTASASYFLTGNTIEVGGFASAAYSRFGTAATTHAGTVSGVNDLLVSGGFEVDGSAAFDGFALFGGNASVAGNFELNGASSKLGINAGKIIDTAFEVGGAASVSGRVDFGGAASISTYFSAGAGIAGTSSFNFDNNSATTGACIKIKDNDGSGYTYLRVSNGVGTFSTVSCR